MIVPRNNPVTTTCKSFERSFLPSPISHRRERKERGEKRATSHPIEIERPFTPPDIFPKRIEKGRSKRKERRGGRKRTPGRIQFRETFAKIARRIFVSGGEHSTLLYPLSGVYTVTWQRGIEEVRHDSRRDSAGSRREGGVRVGFEREKKEPGEISLPPPLPPPSPPPPSPPRGEAEQDKPDQGWLLCPPPFRPFHLGPVRG